MEFIKKDKSTSCTLYMRFESFTLGLYFLSPHFRRSCAILWKKFKLFCYDECEFVSIANVKWVKSHSCMHGSHGAHSIGSQWQHNLKRKRNRNRNTNTFSFPMNRFSYSIEMPTQTIFVLNTSGEEKTDLFYEFVHIFDYCVIVRWNFLREFRLRNGIERCSALK